MTNIYVVGGSNYYANWIKDHVIVDDMRDANLVMFTGGEDVSPSLYGEKIGKYTSFNLNRDVKEMDAFDKASSLKLPMIGICRGSQFLCVMSGGRLIQHQSNRFWIHPMKTFDGKVLDISSTHHQAQYPYDMDERSFKLIGWTEGLSKFHLDGRDKEISKKPIKEAEIVFYPHTNSLGIQGHPESLWRERNSYKETFDYLHGLVDNLLNKTF